MYKAIYVAKNGEEMMMSEGAATPEAAIEDAVAWAKSEGLIGGEFPQVTEEDFRASLRIDPGCDKWESSTPYGSLAVRRAPNGEWSAEVGSDADTQARLDEVEAEEMGAGLRTLWEEVVQPVALDIAAAGYDVAVTDADSTIYLRIRDGEKPVYIVVDSQGASVTDSDPALFPNYEPVR